jgi:hypothetical protein
MIPLVSSNSYYTIAMDTNDNRRTEEMTLGFSGIRNFDLSRDPQRQPQKKEETRGPPITTHNNMLLRNS